MVYYEDRLQRLFGRESLSLRRSHKETRLHQGIKRCRRSSGHEPNVAGYVIMLIFCTVPNNSDSGMELCLAASINDLAALKAWKEAGVDMGACDYDGRSALLLVLLVVNFSFLS